MDITTIWFILFSTYFQDTHASLRWLSRRVGEVKTWTDVKCLDKHLPFTLKQRRVCRQNLDFMKYISSGARGAKYACRETFVVEKWNCDSILKAPRFGTDISLATRQSAAAHAITASYLVHHMVSDCARSRADCPKCKERIEEVVPGQLKGKGEEKVEEIVHKSGACNEMFAEPMKFAKEFTKPGKKKMERLQKKDPVKRAEAEIQYHNKKIGFEIAYKTRSPRCYCHGATKTCYSKICYTAMDFFYEAEQKLKDLYHKAKRVEITKDGQIIPYGDPTGKILSDELIYSDTSFDVCKTEKGNENRQCNINPEGVIRDGNKLCKDICCGGKYEKRPVRIRSECYCKFRWCCEVKCKICTKMDFRYFCTA